MEGFSISSDYLIHNAIIICLYLILSHSYNFHFGLGRLFNLAHVAVYAIGAYTTALLWSNFQLSSWICVPASMIVSGFFALLIGAISLKLSDHYFAIGTLAFSAIVNAVLVNWKSVTHGVLGVSGIPRPDFLGVDFNENRNFLVLIGLLAGLTMIFFWCLFHSRLARDLQAQAENEWAALSLKKNTARVRNLSFFISSMFAGLAGSMFAYYINYIDPSSFTLAEMVFVLSIVVVGRPGSFWGVTAATVFLVILPEALRFTEIDASILGPTRQMLYALILFTVVYVQKEKLFPVERRV